MKPRGQLSIHIMIFENLSLVLLWFKGHNISRKKVVDKNLHFRQITMFSFGCQLNFISTKKFVKWKQAKVTKMILKKTSGHVQVHMTSIQSLVWIMYQLTSDDQLVFTLHGLSQSKLCRYLRSLNSNILILYLSLTQWCTVS